MSAKNTTVAFQFLATALYGSLFFFWHFSQGLYGWMEPVRIWDFHFILPPRNFAIYRLLSPIFTGPNLSEQGFCRL